jgi:hypothetical protein
MKEKGTSRGKSRKEESPAGTAAAGPDGKVAQAKPAELTAKEKIAANQKNKRRK